jgi:hypothetical protein
MTTRSPWWSLALLVLLVAPWSQPRAQTPQPSEAMRALALELSKEPSIGPIPLRDAGGKSIGVIYDAIMVQAVRARTVPDTAPSPRPSQAPAMVIVVAYPMACGGQPVTPTKISLIQRSQPAQPMGILRQGNGAQATLPGETWPDGSGLMLFPALPLEGANVQVDYPESECPEAASTVTASITGKRAEPTAPFVPWLRFPDGTRGVLSPSWVVVSAWIDTRGRTRFAEVGSGPEPLAGAATAYVEGLEFSQWTINDTPVSMQVSFNLGFTRTGEPPPATATSNSRSAEIRTDPSPGLTTATSRCAVSDDRSYGYDMGNPIKVGGDPMEGPARQRAFLANLRGPAGEAVTFRRLGTVPVGVNGVGGLLDLYAVVHADLEESVQLYLDLYAAADLKAPVGFACPAPFKTGGSES